MADTEEKIRVAARAEVRMDLLFMLLPE